MERESEWKMENRERERMENRERERMENHTIITPDDATDIYKERISPIIYEEKTSFIPISREDESRREDIEERISNNEEELEKLREYRQEIEDDKEGGEFAEIHDMYEADRTDDKISDREERIDELNEQLDEDTGSDDYDNDDR